MALNIFSKKENREKDIKTKEINTDNKSGEVYQILIGPHVTEKATTLASDNIYVFKIYRRSNKVKVKDAVEKLYNVNVLNVKIVNIPRKKKRRGRTQGFKSGYKKAIVRLKEGQQIDIMPK